MKKKLTTRIEPAQYKGVLKIGLSWLNEKKNKNKKLIFVLTAPRPPCRVQIRSSQSTAEKEESNFFGKICVC